MVCHMAIQWHIFFVRYLVAGLDNLLKVATMDRVFVAYGDSRKVQSVVCLYLNCSKRVELQVVINR